MVQNNYIIIHVLLCIVNVTLCYMGVDILCMSYRVGSLARPHPLASKRLAVRDYSRPLNSHCFTVRLKVFGQSSRSHCHTLKSHCEKGISDSEC